MAEKNGNYKIQRKAVKDNRASEKEGDVGEWEMQRRRKQNKGGKNFRTRCFKKEMFRR